jgi:aminoglycoside phosphotransferase (APT) family kinase protein
VPGAGALTALHADILELRRGIGQRVPPDPDAWSRLAETVAQLPAAQYQPALSSPAGRETQAPAMAPRDRLWSSADRVLGYVNRVHGTGYCLGTRLGGAGSSSIYLLDEPGRDHAVLKWNRDPATAAPLRQAGPLIAAARRGGWPAPAWLAPGTTPSGFPYLVQEHAPGTPSGRVTAELVRAVLPVLDVQAGLAPDAGHDWSASDRRIVFVGEPAAADPVPADAASFPGSGDTALSPAACWAADTDDGSFSPDTDDASPAEVVAAFSPGGAAFVESVRAWVSPFRSVTLAGGNLVHGNLVPANVLLDGGRLTALTSAEGAGKGSRMHDVASLAVHALLWDGEPGALDDLLGYGASHARPGELEISLAARLLGVVARHVTHDPHNAGDLIDQAAAGLARLGHADQRLARSFAH